MKHPLSASPYESVRPVCSSQGIRNSTTTVLGSFSSDLFLRQPMAVDWAQLPMSRHGCVSCVA